MNRTHKENLSCYNCDGCDTHHMDYCQERCYGRSWHGYLLAHTQSFLFPSSSSFLSFSIVQIRGQSPVSSRSSVPYYRDRDKILKLPTPHGLGGLGLEKAT